jgi:hypothetical protein
MGNSLRSYENAFSIAHRGSLHAQRMHYGNISGLIPESHSLVRLLGDKRNLVVREAPWFSPLSPNTKENLESIEPPLIQYGGTIRPRFTWLLSGAPVP